MNLGISPFRTAVACWLVACWAIVLGCDRSDLTQPTVSVFVAASLCDTFQEIADAFERATGTRVLLNVGASGTLANQIAAGAKADVFISANPRWIEFLRDTADTPNGQNGPNAAIAPSDRAIPIARNRLVVVANANCRWELERLEQLPDVPFRYLCLGDPKSVPAGSYAQAALAGVQFEATTVWQAIDDRVARSSDIRRVLALVESDQTLVGVVYATQATAAANVRVVFRLPATVDYLALAMTRAGQRKHPQATALIDFLSSPAAQEYFERAGFEPSDESITARRLLQRGRAVADGIESSASVKAGPAEVR